MHSPDTASSQPAQSHEKTLMDQSLDQIELMDTMLPTTPLKPRSSISEGSTPTDIKPPRPSSPMKKPDRPASPSKPARPDPVKPSPSGRPATSPPVSQEMSALIEASSNGMTGMLGSVEMFPLHAWCWWSRQLSPFVLAGHFTSAFWKPHYTRSGDLNISCLCLLPVHPTFWQFLHPSTHTVADSSLHLHSHPLPSLHPHSHPHPSPRTPHSLPSLMLVVELSPNAYEFM